jgi:hypothetical protein
VDVSGAASEPPQAAKMNALATSESDLNCIVCGLQAEPNRVVIKAFCASVSQIVKNITSGSY